jgi:hypothetical protein
LLGWILSLPAKIRFSGHPERLEPALVRGGIGTHRLASGAFRAKRKGAAEMPRLSFQDGKAIARNSGD